ncbi:MAG: amino acid adenylation domain-containing protein [Clostridia bacterium]
MEKKYYDLTNPQQSIWLTEQFYKDTSINHICGTVLLHETVNFSFLEKAIKLFVRDNDSFRIKLTFDEEGKVRQSICPFSTFPIELISLKNDEDLKLLEKEMVKAPLFLMDQFLFCFKMFQFPDGHGGFVVTAHHLISDACTAGLLASKVITIYTALLENTENLVAPTSYLSYILSEKDYLSSDKFEKDKAYWDSVFDTVPEIGVIPSVLPSTTDSCRASRQMFVMPCHQVEKIHHFCTKNKVSIFNFFMALYAIYIGRVSQLDDFVLGTPILNRTTFTEKNTPGMFISTVPFRFHVQNNSSFVDFIKQVAIDALGMFRHQKYPYQNILEHIRSKNPSAPNLYDILISYQNTRTNKNTAKVNYEVRWTFNDFVADAMQIHLFDMNDEGSLNIAYDYRLDKYSKEDIYQIHNRILYMIEQVLSLDSIFIQDIEIVTPEEKQKLLYDFNKTALCYDEHKTLVDFFEEQVSKHPNQVALVFENQFLTYEQLNCKINHLAHLLRRKSIKNNDIVGIMTHRSFEMIIYILAVLKAGGSYISIDPEYPDDRIAYMLSDSKSTLLLSQKDLKDKIEHFCFQGEVIFADLSNTAIYKDPYTDNPPSISHPDDLSYIIYTSGSTGQPKGVMLTQRNLTNFIFSMKNKIDYLKDDYPHSIISITTVSFDIFIFETLVSLCSGLKLFLTNETEQKITMKLERLILDNQIEIIQSTPSIMRFHIENSSMNGFKNLKYVMLAGEQLPKLLVDKIKSISPSCIIYNGYGPSETTIFSTVKNVTNLDKITIGEPIDNTQIYILDKHLNVLPPKTFGEIYIAGDGVGNGYLYKNSITQERYLKNPYLANSVFYKTGDIGYWLPNGSIICGGRSDNQVKVHGLRIELDEIENAINHFDKAANIKSAVLLKSDNQKTSLNAFLSSSLPIDLKALRSYLSSRLPNYMIPNTYTILDILPYTPNGKINRKALGYYQVSVEKTDEVYTLPRNSIEEIIITSIKKKLNLTQFGIDNNIFDFGADSLAIIHILTDLFQYHLNLKVYDFYKYPTVRQLYDHLLSGNELQTQLDTEKFIALDSFVKTLSSNYEATSIQKPLSFLITGATGFLGAHILAELLEHSSSIKTIYCAVRKKENLSITDRLLDKFHFYFSNHYDELIKEHVICIESDINDEMIGIAPSYLSIFEKEVDVVIHCAANVKHYGNYLDFQKTNIQGTKNIIQLCKQLSLPLHYISTMTISGNYLIEQKNTNSVFDEHTFFSGQSFDDNVYSKSKLIAESLVIEAISQGLNASIYRIGDLTGRYVDGVFQKNIEENSIYLRLKSILEIGCISSDLLENTLEFSPVDYAAQAICKIIWSEQCYRKIFHIYNPNFIKVSTLLEYMHQLHYNIDVLSPESFMKRVKDFSADISKQSKITGIINDFTRDNDFIYNHILKTDNTLTCHYLENLQFTWPTLDDDYIEKLFNYMKSVHFFSDT